MYCYIKIFDADFSASKCINSLPSKICNSGPQCGSEPLKPSKYFRVIILMKYLIGSTLEVYAKDRLTTQQVLFTHSIKIFYAHSTVDESITPIDL